MPDALTLETMSPGLLKVVERAKMEPEGRFHSLAHLLDVPALMRAYRRMRKDAEGRKPKADPMAKRTPGIPGPSACHEPFGS